MPFSGTQGPCDCSDRKLAEGLFVVAREIFAPSWKADVEQVVRSERHVFFAIKLTSEAASPSPPNDSKTKLRCSVLGRRPSRKDTACLVTVYL